MCCETLREGMAPLFTQIVTSRAVIGTRSSQGFEDTSKVRSDVPTERRVGEGVEGMTDD